MKVLSPLECSRGLDDQVVLSIIDEDVNLVLKKMFNQSDILHHEISKESLVDVTALRRVNNSRIELESVFDVRTIEERLKNEGRILFV